MKKVLIGLMGLAFFGLASAYADNPQPLPSGFVSNSYTISMSGAPWVAGSANLNQGGAFDGTITGGGLTKGLETAFWCVDDQLYFAGGQSGTANIVLLPTIDSGNGQFVQYNNVNTPPGPPNPVWTNSLDFGNSNVVYDAQARYEMAAWLVSQYNDGTLGYSEPVPSGASSALQYQNSDIQEAIWALTSNTSSSNESGASHPVSGLTSNQLTLLQDAITGYTSSAGGFTPSDWAVVSWTADANGNLNGGNYNAGNDNGARQTFLVEIAGGGSTHIESTPEPGFYGALALGLSGLIFSRSRRKKNA